MTIDIKKLRKIMRTDDGINGDAQRLEQLVWMLFMKLFDTKEDEWQIKATLNKESYESAIPEKYRWKNWADDETGITGDELIEFVEQMFKDLKVLKVNNIRTQIVHDVFADTHNYMKSGTVLRQTINEINKADFNVNTDRHEFNDIYESMLAELQSAGSAGEFYTPRPVTEFVVDMVKPQINERVLDFACGTGGFLTCTLDYLQETNQTNTPDALTKVQKNVVGIEKKQLPYALCMTNLLLHGVDIPNIEHRNSLTGQVSGFSDKQQVDVIVTNPPYGGIEEEGVSSSFAKEYQTKETADLFMALLMEKLSDNGRAGIVLPDSILFGDGVKANIKRRLLKEFNLHTIVRLPEGVFAPYTSITTNLLFFNRDSKGTNDIWYYELELPEGQQRFTKTNPIKKSNFDNVKSWWNNRTENAQAWKVNVKDLKNYNLDIKNPSKIDDTESMTAEEIIDKMKELTNENNEILSKLGDLLK
jgi:type I restriction enzyme M protein